MDHQSGVGGLVDVSAPFGSDVVEGVPRALVHFDEPPLNQTFAGSANIARRIAYVSGDIIRRKPEVRLSKEFEHGFFHRRHFLGWGSFAIRRRQHIISSIRTEVVDYPGIRVPNNARFRIPGFPVITSTHQYNSVSNGCRITAMLQGVVTGPKARRSRSRQ